MADRNCKIIPVPISYSDQESEGEESGDEKEGESSDEEEEGNDDEDVDYVISGSSSEDESELSDQEVDRESVADDSEDSPPDKVDCSRVIHLLQGGHVLDSLKLEECKAYLRKHGLRVTGTKSVCIERIQEHWRINDGNGEKLYPKTSFSINCTGDVCTGDVVLFTQRVYEKFDKVTRGGNLLGMRTIAGRVVKESYGAAKQQHTFTVEILWNKGVKTLPPLFPLLVKGRNLYRLKTFRQRWDNEVKRSKDLAEKHKRGAEARHVRAIRKARSANGPMLPRHSNHARAPPRRRSKHESEPSTKRRHKTCGNPSLAPATLNKDSVSKAPTLSGSKHQRCSHLRKPLRERQRNGEPDPITGPQKHSLTQEKAQSSWEERNMKSIQRARELEASARHFQQAIPYGTQNDPLHTYYQTRMQYYKDINPAFTPDTRQYPLPNYEMGSSSTAIGLAKHQMAPPTFHHQVLNGDRHNHPYRHAGPIFDPRSLRYSQTHSDLGRHFLAVPGFQDRDAENWVGTFCWNCCGRTARKCHRHHI